MFCPKCGVQNKDEQKFCRGCGQSLSSVRVALEGRVDEAVPTLAKSLDKLASGALTLAIFVAVAFLINAVSGDRPTIALNLFLGLIIGGTILLKGIRRLQRQIKQLDPKEQVKPVQPSVLAASLQPEVSQAALPPVPDTDPLAVTSVPSSVTEHTTFQLKHPE